MSFTRLAAFLAGTTLSVAASATQTPPEGGRVHDAPSQDIVVTAAFARDRFEMPTAVSVLEGADLLREARPTIGETLARQPGVTSSFFGPSSSRPILRGLDAERVRILTDGIGSFDVSNSSADHAVAINPLTADRVEVVRGPASLLFGSSAIGGVVNVTDRRIARDIPEEFAHIDANMSLGSAAKERSFGTSIDLPVAKTGLVLHADGSFLKTGDYRTGGYIYSESVRHHGEHHGHEAEEAANVRGRVQNSDAKTWEVAGGISWIGERGNMGFSVSHMNSNYGVPNRLTFDEYHHDDHHGHDDHSHQDHDEHAEDHNDDEHAHDHNNIRIDMRQTRVDARGELLLDGRFERLAMRFGFADYQHHEIDDHGHKATSFYNEGLEGRLELVQRKVGGWRGASGVQYMARRFQAVGEEAAVPLNNSTQLGLFTVQDVDLGVLNIEAGARYERSSVESSPLRFKRAFNAISGSVGVSVPMTQGLRFATNLAYSERAPSPEELLSNGAHAATQSYEVGDLTLNKERSLGVEAVLRGRGEGWRFELSGFYNRFYDFIYLSPNGDTDHGLPVYAYSQAGADHWGVEAEASVRVLQAGDWNVEVTGLADFVRAEIRSGGGNAPRIPPMRFVGGVEAGNGQWGGRVEVERTNRQDRVAVYEDETPAWTMVNASINWKPFGAGSPTTIVASANNIFDVEARRHSSFLKHYAPLAGRDFRLSARFTF